MGLQYTTGVWRIWMMGAILMPAAGICAKSEDPALKVSVCVNYQAGGDFSTANLSKAIASGMFRRIGVALIWVNSKSCPPDGIRITLTGNTPASLQPGAMA